MRLFIVRHGEAEAQTSTDANRALTSKGISDAKSLGLLLQKESVVFTQIVVSPYCRAQQTLENILSAFNIAPEIHVLNTITPNNSVALAKQSVEPLLTIETLLLVSHLPLVSAMIADLVEGDERMAPLYPMMPASVAELHLDTLMSGSATLQRLLSPPYYD
jgi:phosphohistidine phosphatase